jgi:hypothetical protein
VIDIFTFDLDILTKEKFDPVTLTFDFENQ